MAGQGLDRIPLRIPERWSAEWFETFVRDVLSMADVRNATEGLGISITGQSDDVATIAASEDVLALLNASLLTATPPDLDNARQLVAGDGSIELDDNGAGATLALSIAQHGIKLDKLVQIPALSILATQNTTNPATLEVVQSTANDRLVRRVGDAIDFGELTLPMIPDGLITFGKLQDADALSVLGRSANTAGVLDEIAAANDHEILRRSGAAIGFGSIDLSQSGAVGTSRLALANITQITGQAVLGVASAGSGNLAAISAGTNDRLLSQVSGVLGFTQLTAGMFPATVVPDAALSPNVALLNRNPQTFTGANAWDFGGGSKASIAGLTSVSCSFRAEGLFAKTEYVTPSANADSGKWQQYATSSGSDALRFGMLNDAENAEVIWMAVSRSGLTATEVELNATTFDFNGNLDLSGTVTSPNTSAEEVGYKGWPQKSIAADYEIAPADQGKTLWLNTAADDITVVAASLPVGGFVKLVNELGFAADIIQGSGALMFLAGTGFSVSGNRVLAHGGIAEIYHWRSGFYVISGFGLS